MRIFWAMVRKAVADVLVLGHAALERLAAQNARAEHDVVKAGFQDVRHGRHQLGRVLVVGVKHDDDIGASFERGLVAGFLVAAVAAVFGVNDGLESQLLGHHHGFVAAGVIHEDDFVHHVHGDLGARGLQGLARVVGGHDNDHFLSTYHGGRPPV
jgi:hypothetical protein